MKRLLLIMTVLFFTVAYSQDSKLLASCCEGKDTKSFGRCSGDAYCTACTNCRYCKHCSKEGGSCGVCATYTEPVKKTVKRNSAIAAKQPSQYYRNQSLEVTSEILNAREGAGKNYDVVETLHQGDILTFLLYDGDWIYVKINSSGAHGYVYYKYVKKFY